jgi:ABC-type multidrug transport system ATPase subunit
MCALGSATQCHVILPAGAGKTTLMDVLAGRKTTGRTEGQVWVDGHPKEQHTFARVCGYVEQTDIHTARVSSACRSCR